MEMIDNYVYLFALVILFVVLTVKVVEELLYQKRIKGIAALLLSYPVYICIAYYLIFRL